MIKRSPEKLFLHIIWIFGLLEMITVPMVAWLPGVISIGTKSPAEGAVVGFFGIVLLFFILNRVLHVLQLKLENDTITGISIFTLALWNTLLLTLLFGIQQAMSLISIRPMIIHQVISGFISTFGAVFITIFLYHLLGKIFIWSRITVKTDTSIYMITQFSILLLAFMAGLYEAIALPVILIWQNVNSSPVFVAALTGFTGGVLGSGIIVVCYNYFKFPRIYLFLEKSKKII